MKYLILLLCFCLAGCATSSDHTKRGDEILKESLIVIEKYFAYDAKDDPMKKEYFNQITEIREEAEKHANEDPSVFKGVGEAAQSAIEGYGGLLTGGGGILATIALAWLRGRKKKQQTDNLVNELIKTPDEKECLKKVREAKFA